MSKYTPVLICPTEDLHSMSEQERNVVRRFLFQRLRGMGAVHDRRWKRMWWRVFNLAPGEGFELIPMVERSLKYHGRHMAIETAIFESQEGFPPTKAGRRAFENWLKVGASLCRLEINGGEAKWIPGSRSFDSLSDDEAREFHEAAVDFLREPMALRKLWPHVKPAERIQMLEAALSNPNEHQEPAHGHG